MNEPTGTTALPVRRGNSRRTRIALLAFILSPLVVLTVLILLIADSMKHGRDMNAPAVGAGAGHTGMANEYMGVGKEPPKR